MLCPCGLRAVKYFVILCSGLQPPAARLPPPAIELKFQGFPPRGHDRRRSASFVQAQSESLQLSSAHNFVAWRFVFLSHVQQHVLKITKLLQGNLNQCSIFFFV